jgi:hypothetical protein
VTITDTILLRSKTFTLGDSFCESYELGYNARSFAALGIPALLAIIMLTTATHAFAFWGGGYYCEAPWARHDPNCYNSSYYNIPNYLVCSTIDISSVPFLL